MAVVFAAPCVVPENERITMGNQEMSVNVSPDMKTVGDTGFHDALVVGDDPRPCAVRKPRSNHPVN